ncbi:hypothetical protein WKV44_05485 [Spirochaetia bacterium 38H-sp]|uniref:Lipoprotein n=1 Tax=Rarispira pelagica TaxID=3141764 RepID=A0ABU9UCW9_9SPIR
MKLYRNILLILYIFLVIFACKNNTDKKDMENKSNIVPASTSIVRIPPTTASVTPAPVPSRTSTVVSAPPRSVSPEKNRTIVSSYVNPLFLSWILPENPAVDTMIGVLVGDNNLSAPEEKSVGFLSDILKKRMPVDSSDMVKNVLSRFFSFLSSRGITLENYRLGKAIFDDSGKSHLNFKIYSSSSFAVGEIVLSLDKEKWILDDFIVDTASLLEEKKEKAFVLGDYAMLPLY